LALALAKFIMLFSRSDSGYLTGFLRGPGRPKKELIAKAIAGEPTVIEQNGKRAVLLPCE
jgi:hypothetical protein